MRAKGCLTQPEELVIQEFLVRGLLPRLRTWLSSWLLTSYREDMNDTITGQCQPLADSRRLRRATSDPKQTVVTCRSCPEKTIRFVYENGGDS